MFGTLDFKSYSDFIPPFEVPVEIENVGETLTQRLEQISLDEEDYIRNTYPGFVNKLGKNPEEESKLEDWLTNRAFEYNLLKFADKYPELNDLKHKIYLQWKNYITAVNGKENTPYIQMWINVLKPNGRYFTKHHHAHPSRIGNPLKSYVSGHICVKAINTKTYYYSPFIDVMKIGIPNVPGECTLFPGWVNHETDPNLSNEPRITLAFDIITEEMYIEGKMDNPSNYIKLE